MKVIKTKSEMNRISLGKKRKGREIGLVPTMGFLHKGHISLIEKSKSECDVTVVSIFVNPVQFGPNEDYLKYPRDFERDSEIASKYEVDYVFFPEKEEMYSDNHLTYINVEKIGKIMCGKFRPGHFRGVCTVVNKLFNIIEPDRAYFGLKDYQQLVILKKMVSDLDMNVRITECDTVREEDGLAVSSRNTYLGKEERQSAGILYSAIKHAEKELNEGKDINSVKKDAENMLKGCSFVKKIDYFDLRDPETLRSIKKIDANIKRVLIAGAIWLGDTRLIDNKIVAIDR